jgi:hypothetical protein
VRLEKEPCFSTEGIHIRTDWNARDVTP